jgi:hypothetical protein
MLQYKTIALLSILFMGFAFLLTAENRLGVQKNPIQPRITHAEMAKKQKVTKPDAQKPVRMDEVHTNKQHRKTRQKNGLIGRSSIISSGYNWTLVPKEAVLYVPPLYKKRVNDKRNGELIGWQDFYAKNRSWIKVVPVTIPQARGEDPLTEEFLKSIQSAGQIAIAVCQGGPISVKAPQEDPEDPAVAAKLAEAAAEKRAREAAAFKDMKRRLEAAAR